MKLSEATIENTPFSSLIKNVYSNLMGILLEAEVGSPEFNYAWDMIRNHVDHFKYREMDVRNPPQMLRPQPPLEVPCCN